MEELVENKRAELSARSDLTPVTLETFVKWKKRKLREKAEAAKKDVSKKKDNLKSGQTTGLSGRELFSYNPNMAGEEVSTECTDKLLQNLAAKTQGLKICGLLVFFILFYRTMMRKDAP